MQADLRPTIDALPTLAWTAQPSGDVDFLNRPWCDYTGLRLEEALGSGWLSAICPDDLARLQKYWQSILLSGEPGEIEARLRRHDGVYRWFLFRANPLRDSSGELTKWYGTNTDIEDRVRADEARRVSELHLRRMVDSIPAFIAVMGPTGALEVVNRPCLEYFGKTLQELQAWMAAGDAVHPDDLPRVIKTWARSVETGQSYEIKHRMRRFDGVYRWFHLRGQPIRDDNGRVINWYVVQFDIEEQVQTEALLSGENRLIKMIATGSPIAAICDELCKLVEETIPTAHCTITLADETRSFLDRVYAPSLPSSFGALVVGKPIDANSGACAQAVFSNEQVLTGDVESETRWADSGWRELALQLGVRACWSTPIVNRDGEGIGSFAIIYEEPRVPNAFDQSVILRVTHIARLALERDRADAALRRSEAFLKQAQHLSSTGSFSWCVSRNEHMWSDETYRIFEVDMGLPVTFDLIRAHVHPDDIDKFATVLESASREAIDVGYELRLRFDDGRIKYLYVTAQATKNISDELEYIGAVQDITQRRIAVEALEQARAELARVARIAAADALTASIAHQINQPLSGIAVNASTSLRVLRADPPNVSSALDAIERTIRDCDRATKVVSRVRALYQKSEIADDWVDLNEVTREVVMLSEVEIQRAGAVVQTELQADLPLLRGDRVQLQQVVLNLLLNGVEAMSGVSGRSRRLVIRTDVEQGDCVRLSVEDTGVGLNPNDLTRPFEPFYTTKPAGMGIGLSISRSIIQSHFGRLWATPNDGPGVTFAFSIPRELDRAAS